MNPRETIAKRIARELKDGDLVNLGIGMPTMVANYLPPDVQVILQTENGFVGMGPTPFAWAGRQGHHQRRGAVRHGLARRRLL